MRLLPAVRSSDRAPRSGDQRRRLLRHHLPLAVTSAAVLVLLMTLPAFDTSADHGAVDISSGALPRPRSERSADVGGADEGGTTEHGGEQSEPTDHGRDQGGTTEHGGEQSEPTDHGRDQGGTTEHGGGQDEETDGDRGMDMTGDRAFVQRFTVATGYVATGLLAFTLLVGPANLVLRRRNPLSSYLRRDAGLWTAVFSVVHVIYGLQVHGPLSGFLSYFVAPDGSPWLNSFGLGNWTGLAATVIVMGLLAISSDFALGKLTARPWKWLQRLNYALYALVIAHAFFYGALLRTTSPFTLLLVLSVLAVLGGQAVGVWLWRRRSARMAARSA